MFEAIKYAIGKGIPVVISTRVPSGRVLPVYGFAGGGKTLKDAGAIFADDLTPQKARILLMLAIQAGVKDTQALQKLACAGVIEFANVKAQRYVAALLILHQVDLRVQFASLKP